MDIKKEINESFSQIADKISSDADNQIDKNLILNIIDVFEKNIDKKEKALANLIISEIEKYSEDLND